MDVHFGSRGGTERVILGEDDFFLKIISDDVEGHASYMSGWRLNYDQVTSGVFSGGDDV